jgi:hypothetical protein
MPRIRSLFFIKRAFLTDTKLGLSMAGIPPLPGPPLNICDSGISAPLKPKPFLVSATVLKTHRNKIERMVVNKMGLMWIMLI